MARYATDVGARVAGGSSPSLHAFVVLTAIAALAAAGDLVGAAHQQREARYWCSFFTSPQGSSVLGRATIARQWGLALDACEVEVSAAVNLAQKIAQLHPPDERRLALSNSQVPPPPPPPLVTVMAPAALTGLHAVLTVPYSSPARAFQVEQHYQAIAEIARVAGRIGMAVSCHAVWLDTAQATALLGRAEELQAQYSVMVSHLLGAAEDASVKCSVPLPAAVFSETEAGGRELVATGFPGEDAVCALTLHPFVDNTQSHPPVHELALEWRGQRYFAPCANLLANRCQRS